MIERAGGGGVRGSCPLSNLGGIMYGWCTFRARHGGRPVADHLLQIAALLVSLAAFPQEQGDGFSESDRDMLRDVRSIASGNSTDLGIIKTAVIHTRDTVDQIETDIESIDSSLEAIATRQSGFNATQQNMYNTLLNWEAIGVPGTEDLPLIQQNTYNAATHLSYIRSDVADISDNTTQINGHLLNIDRETTESSDYLHSIDQNIHSIDVQFERLRELLTTNNAVAGGDIIVALTNALSLYQSQPVDLSIVTNFFAAESFPFITATFFPLFGARYGDLIRDMLGFDPDYDLTADDYASVFGSSQMGFFMYMLIQSLFPNPDDIYDSVDLGSPNLFVYAWENFAKGAQDYESSLWVDWPYTIFEAYNTLGLGVLTNQANTLISQGVYVTNSLAVIVSNLVASLSVAEKTKDALYYPEDSETIYETTNHYSIPEWEPTYHAGIADNTNHYYYFQQADSFTRSLIGNYTSLLGRVIGGIKPQHRDWDAKITWSGWPSMQGQYGGWDLDVKLPETPDVVDFAKYIKFLSRLVCFVLDLLIVLLGATRIHKTVMGGKLPFES